MHATLNLLLAMPAPGSLGPIAVLTLLASASAVFWLSNRLGSAPAACETRRALERTVSILSDLKADSRR
ncbi:hypothetical protein VARIO8X_120013 [Burkholderiales bacterium 8X]|nr:hypothetical protein VARIO8X_120013 [Burkholderiales bacterium 8X]